MRRRTVRRARLVAAVVVLTASTPAAVLAAPACDEPTVNTLIAAEAAVSRPALRSPSELALSNVYSQVEQATKPAFVYAEGGPQFAGAFEALTPPGTPPPPRAVAAFPSEDIPDDDTEDWGGTSRATVTPVSGTATSSGGRALGVGDATAEHARSWVSSTVECDVITVIAGWSASNVVFAPGVTATEMGERVTLVVAPTGSSADVEITLVGLEGAESATIEGRPLDPFTDPMRENGGPTVEAGEARAESGPEGAFASGGGFNFLFTDPETGQGAGYRIGSLEAKVEVLGELTSASPIVADAPPVVAAPALLPSATAPAPVTPAAPTRSVTGAPPPPSSTALEIERAASTDVVFSAVTVTTRTWLPLVAFLATVASIAAAYGAARVNRERFPTLDWLLAKSDRKALRFLAVYLRW